MISTPVVSGRKIHNDIYMIHKDINTIHKYPKMSTYEQPILLLGEMATYVLDKS